MRGATQCARRLKRLFRALRTRLGKVRRLPTGDAITQMILGIFSRDVPESKARQALDRLRAVVVDYNELRVIPPIEMAEMVGELPEARLKCEDLSRALNKVFLNEHEVSLERLSRLPRREVLDYLGAIDGLDAYSRARVRLLGLQQHAVPLDEAMWAYARKTEIVHRNCSLEEAQAFLERRIPEGDALEFVTLLEKQAWVEMGAAVRSGQVRRIRSVPPDRTARNLLQLVASGSAGAFSAPEARAGGARKAGRSATARTTPGAVNACRPSGRRTVPKTARGSQAPRSTAKRPARSRPAGRSPAKAKPGARVGRKRKPTRRGRSRTGATVRGRPAKRARRPSAKARSA